ncbi:SDR family oxidoreductase [Brevundimonas sp.]|uniref:SDR family oxidoreductase n=1 Tax=Brevundimonas sp. TaxID=1871086 RepID=UPI003D6D43DB
MAGHAGHQPDGGFPRGQASDPGDVGAGRRLADLHLDLRRPRHRHAGHGGLAGAKAGLVGLSRVIAAEFGARGVRSNCLLPGGTDTEAGREFAHTPEIIAFVEGMHALKRMATPDEIARVALFLASDASSFMTGTAMLVDGGVSISKT